MRIVDIIKDFAKRFPTAALMGLMNCVLACCMNFGADDGFFVLFFLSVILSVASVAAQLVCERRQAPRRTELAVQGAALVLFVLLSFWLYEHRINERNICYYMLTLAGVCSLATWVLGRTQQKPETVPHLVAYAGCMGGVVGTAFMLGIMFIFFTLKMLFGAVIPGRIFEVVFLVSFTFLAFEVFLLYVTRREDFEPPKPFKTILVFVLLPLYLLFLCVLWIYLLTCVFGTLPNGEINWLVSAATGAFIGFHFLLAPYAESKVIRVLRNYGALLLLPLIALQVVAVVIRLNAYGLTPVRYGSLLYILFSAVFMVLTLVARKYVNSAAYLLFAAFVAFAAYSHWNVIDTGVRAQKARIVKFYRQFGLFDNETGEIVPTGAREKLPKEVQLKICESVHFVNKFKEKSGKYYWGPSYLTDNEFADKYGFEQSWQDKRRYGPVYDKGPFSHHFSYWHNSSGANNSVEIGTHGKLFKVTRAVVEKVGSNTVVFVTLDNSKKESNGPRVDITKALIGLAEKGAPDPKASFPVLKLDGGGELVIFGTDFYYNRSEDGVITYDNGPYTHINIDGIYLE